MKLEQEEQRKAERQEKTNDQCCKGHRFIFRNLFLEIYSYTTVMVMCPKQKQNANWNQVEIENWIVRGRNLPRTNSTKCEIQIIFTKKQENEHTPDWKMPSHFSRFSSLSGPLGCARFPEILQNVSERQILWSLCSVVFHAFTLILPIQTSLSVAPELPVCLRSGENCPNFSKTSTPRIKKMP